MISKGICDLFVISQDDLATCMSLGLGYCGGFIRRNCDWDFIGFRDFAWVLYAVLSSRVCRRRTDLEGLRSAAIAVQVQ